MRAGEGVAGWWSCRRAIGLGFIAAVKGAKGTSSMAVGSTVMLLRQLVCSCINAKWHR
ncbi:hypothetical protein ACQU0X_08550 [Pseudovibrio ascidiaceicola]|uniref:hypothetical protein n=1 Tax=Pseudovibrio ascidiaceicola TaxID=285279 RepID=UPI003D3683C7